MVIFWAILVPAPVFLALRKNRDGLLTQEVAERYSFFYKGYKTNVYFWEMLVFLRKYILLVIASMESFISNQMQLYLSLYVIWIALSLQTKYMPYKSRELNRLEIMGLFCAALLNSSGLYYRFVTQTPTVSFILIVTAGIANTFFLIYWTL